MRLRTLALLGMFGCTYRTPPVRLPATFSGFRADRLELGGVVVHEHGKDVSPEIAIGVKDTLRELLVGAASGATISEPSEITTRVTMRVDITRSEDWMANVDKAGSVDGCGAVAALPFVVAVPLGAKTEDEALVVELDVETNGRRFWGRGYAHEEGGSYASARRRALARALDQALASAATHPMK